MLTLCKNEFMYQVAFALDCVERDLLGVATGHGKRVACISMEIARLLNFSELELSDLSACAVLHDNALTEYILAERVGAAPSLPQHIDFAPHCILGEENARYFPFSTDTGGYILYHHEEADASGPFKKSEGDIPLGAAIIHLADQLDSRFTLSGSRADDINEVASYVKENAGKRFDTRAANAFLRACSGDWAKNLAPGSIDRALKSYTACIETKVPIDRVIKMGEVFARIIDYKSPFTKSHSVGIAEKTKTMAEYYNLADDEKANLTLAAYLHDIGKLAVPIEILEKPGKLTDAEYEKIKEHAYLTYKMLSGVSGMETICTWASSHHEKLNGSGYPFKKTAAALDRNSRLLGCIDIYQALCEERPYRKPLAHGEAMDIIDEMAGHGMLDQGIVDDIGAVLGQ